MTQGLELRGAVLGKGYRLGRRLDTDGSSAYEATHERIPGRFIIRLFPPETLAQPESSSRIQRGARVASLLRDPHAVQVLDCNASGEMPAFVVIERVLGRSLAEVMADDGMLPLARVAEVVDSLALALAAGHQIGLVHGDLRPAHVFLPTSGQPAARLSGFGWAKELRAATRLPSPSGYLAPEQNFGKVLTLDERTDQFGLAALTYDMIAACLPFSEESADEADVLSAGRKPPAAIAELVPGLPAGIDEVLRRALAAAPAERFDSVLQLAARFREAASPQGPSSQSDLDLDPSRARQRQVLAVRSGAGDLSSAATGRPSNDVTEELDLASLSFQSEGDDGMPEEEDLEGPTDEVNRPGPNTREPADVDDAELVLGAASPPAPTDDAKTQIVRSPFFEEDSEPASLSEPRVDVPVTTPRRGIPVGRPTVATPATSDSGRVLGHLGTGRGGVPAQLQKTMLGIGPEMLPGYGDADSTAGPWLTRNRWTLPAVGAIVVLAGIVAGRALLSRGSDEDTEDAPAANSVAPVGPAPAAAPSVAAPSVAAPSVAAPSPVPAPPPPPASTEATSSPTSPRTPASEATAAGASANQPSGEGPPPAPPSSRPAPHPALNGQNAKAPIIARVDPLPEKAHSPGPTGEARATPTSPRVQTTGIPTIRRAPQAATPAPGSRPGATAAASQNAAPAAATSNECSIRISSRPWAEVWIDGKNTGRKTPIDSLKVRCGTRKLELKRPDKDIEQMEMLEVLPGKPYPATYDLE